MSVDSWDTVAANNNSIEGVDVSEGSLPKFFNDCFRAMAAAIKVFRNNAYCKDKNVTIQASGGAAPVSPAENDLWIEY